VGNPFSAPTIPTLPDIPKPPDVAAPPAVKKMAPVPAIPPGPASHIAQRPQKTDPPDPAVSIRFHLSLDHQSIGWWNSFEGLGMETSIEPREEGGNNHFIHQLPTRLKYTNIKLSRPINQDSEKVAIWFMNIVKKRERNQTAVIKAVAGPTDDVIAQWSLQEVVPVRWTGPSFSVESPKVATETLELAFHGFLPPAAKGGK